MRGGSTRVAIVAVATVACTAGPVLLPRSVPGPPPPCTDRTIRVDDRLPRTAVGSRVLGRSWIASTDSDRIRWFDPVTLRRIGGFHALPAQTGIWAVSPDGRLVAIGLRSSVRVIDARTLETLTTLDRVRHASRLAWVSGDTLVGVAGTEAFAWDRPTRALRRYDVNDGIIVTLAAADRLLLVTGWREREGDPHLVEITADRVRSVALHRIDAFDPSRGQVGIELVPGLAYDAAGRRAFVIPPEGALAEIDLASRRPVVRYRTPPASFVDRLAGSFLPTADAKLGEWETVRAVWLGEGLLAVSGETGSTMDLDTSAAGVSVLDTTNWKACLLDPGPTHVAVSGDVLIAWGGGEFGELGGTGLVGYDLSDGSRWHRFGRQHLDLQVYGRYGYAINSWDGWRVRTVDLATGTILHRHRGRPPTVLPTGASAGW